MAAVTWWVIACVGPSVRGRNLGRGEAKPPLVQTNLLQHHGREERSPAWLQASLFMGIAVKEKAFET